MKTFLTCTVLVSLGLLFQLLFRHFPLVSVHLDIVWVVVLALGFFSTLLPGGIAVFFLGLIQESLGAPFHGLFPLIYLAVFFFLRGFNQHLFFEGKAPQFIWVVILTIARVSLERWLLAGEGYSAPFDIWNVLFNAGLAGLACLLVFPLFRKPVGYVT